MSVASRDTYQPKEKESTPQMLKKSAKVVYNLGNTYRHVNISDNAMVILGDARIPDFGAEDDPKLLRTVIESRPYSHPVPSVLHAGFPWIEEYESHHRKQIHSARAISPTRGAFERRDSTKKLESLDLAKELKRLCVMNRVTDLEVLLRGRPFNVSDPRMASSLTDALLDATEFGFIDILRALLRYGVNPDLRNDCKDGGALHKAVAVGNLDMIRLLIEFHADVNLPGGPVETALKLALLADVPDGELTLLLLEAGARVQDAAQYPSALQACAYRDQRAILGQLCRYTDPTSINFAHPVHGTALQTAAAYGKLECARILEDFGARFDTPCQPYGSPLHAATYWGQVDMCKMALRDMKYSIVSVDGTSQDTVLHVAVRNGHYDIAKLILTNMSISDSIRLNASRQDLLIAAMSSGSIDILNLITGAGMVLHEAMEGTKAPSVASAIEHGYGAMACAMIDMGHDRDGKPFSFYDANCSPLRTAARIGDLEMVRYLIALHADTHVGAVREAAAAGHHKIVVYLSRRCQEAFEEERDDALLAAIAGSNRITSSYLAMNGAVIYDHCAFLLDLIQRSAVPAVTLLVDLVGHKCFPPATQSNALCVAMNRKETEMLESLLDMFPNASQSQRVDTGPRSSDPIAVATESSDLSGLKLLLRHGFTADGVGDWKKDCPLSRAVKRGDLQLVKLLLHHRTNPSVFVDCRGQPMALLCYAIDLCPREDIFLSNRQVENDISTNNTPKAIVKALIEAGANVKPDEILKDFRSNGSHSEDSNVAVPLDFSSSSAKFDPLDMASRSGLYEIVIALLKRGATFGSTSKRLPWVAVHRALLEHDISSAEMILSTGTDNIFLAGSAVLQAGFNVEPVPAPTTPADNTRTRTRTYTGVRLIPQPEARSRGSALGGDIILALSALGFSFRKEMMDSLYRTDLQAAARTR